MAKTTRKKTPSASKASAAARKKSAAAKKTAKTVTRKRTTTRRTTNKKVSAEERYTMIQTAAYLKAEKNGFAGDPKQYWLEAEKEINAALKASGKKAKK